MPSQPCRAALHFDITYFSTDLFPVTLFFTRFAPNIILACFVDLMYSLVTTRRTGKFNSRKVQLFLVAVVIFPCPLKLVVKVSSITRHTKGSHSNRFPYKSGTIFQRSINIQRLSHQGSVNVTLNETCMEIYNLGVDRDSCTGSLLLFPCGVA